MARPRTFIARDEAHPPFFVGIDLGGTNIKVGLVDDQGHTLAYEHFTTDVDRGPEDASRRMGEAVRREAEHAGLSLDDVARVGLGSPGTMDIPAGLLLQPPNLPGWENFALRDRVAHHAGRAVTFGNDADAAAFGEYWRGSGRGMHNMLLLTLGTGIGSGIIIEGAPLRGEHSHGGECGHMIIDCHDDARICSCGQSGHLEAYASAIAVMKRTHEALVAGRPSSLSPRLAAGESLSPLIIAQEAEAGDILSLAIIMDTARYLGIGIVSLMHTLDPAAVILGGAMTFGGDNSELGRQFMARVQEEVHRRAFPIPAAKTLIRFAKLGNDAGYIGAAGIARRDYHAGK